MSDTRGRPTSGARGAEESTSRQRGRPIDETVTAYVTDEDERASATVQSIEHLTPVLETLRADRDAIDTIVDLGCGFGGLTAGVADLLEATDVHGIDLDPDRRPVASSRGITTHDLDLETEPLPFADGSVDLVLSFGVLEHLRFYDEPIAESNRVLREGGWVLFSIPNLGSWINRLALLFGYQPRDVEISRHRAVGIPNGYPSKRPLNHVHAATHGAFCELLAYHGFEVQSVVGLHPYQERLPVSVADRLVSRWPSLCRRIAVLGRKVGESAAE